MTNNALNMPLLVPDGLFACLVSTRRIARHLDRTLTPVSQTRTSEIFSIELRGKENLKQILSLNQEFYVEDTGSFVVIAKPTNETVIVQRRGPCCSGPMKIPAFMKRVGADPGGHTTQREFPASG